MPHGTLATLAVGLFLVAPSVPAVAQQCVPYEPETPAWLAAAHIP
jgi:hypothetical protein